MEDLVSFSWSGRRVLLTGQSGFKGSWLALWLTRLGATVCGYALDPPSEPNLFSVARISELIEHQRADVRNLAQLKASMAAFRPEIVFHLAAQSLVRRSYIDPVETYETNLLGTVNVLEAVRHTPSVRAVLCITTDKCYENREGQRRFSEDDRLGGRDPYSNSKACAELAVASYRESFLDARGVAVATARAGNVIGGGDWADDRLVPDLMRAFLAGRPARIRNPYAIRPWQHVLEPLRGYLMLAERLLAGDHAFASAWNFGPAEEDTRAVEWIVTRLAQRWAQTGGSMPTWEIDEGPHPHEAACLMLDCARAQDRLGWRPALPLPDALDWIVNWFRQWQSGDDMQQGTFEQIAAYERLVAHG